jgi:hypothetical protein
VGTKQADVAASKENHESAMQADKEIVAAVSTKRQELQRLQQSVTMSKKERANLKQKQSAKIKRLEGDVADYIAKIRDVHRETSVAAATGEREIKDELESLKRSIKTRE